MPTLTIKVLEDMKRLLSDNPQYVAPMLHVTQKQHADETFMTAVNKVFPNIKITVHA